MSLIKICLCFIVVIIFASCGKDELPVSTDIERNPFTGKYEFKFISGITLNSRNYMDVDNKGEFNFSIDLNVTGSLKSYTFTGLIKKNGILEGRVKQDTTNFATFDGQFYNGEGSGYMTGGAIALWKATYIF